MKSEICYSDLPLLMRNIEGNVDVLIENGAEKIELLMDGERWNDMELLFASLAPKLKEKAVGYTVHPPAWDTNLTSENKAIRSASFSEYKKAIEFAGLIQASHVVIHPGFCFSPVFNRELAKQRAFEAIGELCEVARPLQVKLAVENVGYNGESLFTQEEFISFLDSLDDTAGYLLDVGHAHLNDWDIPAVIKAIGDRLLAVHLHDNKGNADDHLPIGEGTIEWEPIFETLREYTKECQLILEYAPGTSLDALREGKELLKKELQLKKADLLVDPY
ncbi:sugar phosphate isomerase/epimerase family protein [Metabacillus malikii]|uniref:Sugar phosphate isomerase/epimerase n=1 Tax=Metabacillus malikii TaxID=1504265 RepID=A0ABT9ZJV5_9BACI|nr:sugar phosphate isomerase/epimerase family protein [Metabacillus malikii]MDQ0232159.1 sugar phosphate isomerase/epimerase [Metabacillus malikii]